MSGEIVCFCCCVCVGFFWPLFLAVLGWLLFPCFLADSVCIYTFVSKWYFRSAVAVVVVLSVLL